MPPPRLQLLLVEAVEEVMQGRVELASPGVLKMLQDDLRHKTGDQNIQFFDAVKGVPGLQVFRGYFLECEAHKELPSKAKVALRKLGGEDAWHAVELPELKRVRFTRKDMGDLTSLAVGDYAEPAVSNFPSVDSFAVVAKSVFFGPRARGNLLAAFQVTVSEAHIVRGPDLQRVHDRVAQLLGVKSIPVALVFVTTAQGVNTAQPIKNSEGNDYVGRDAFVASVDQFALKLGARYDDIATASKN